MPQALIPIYNQKFFELIFRNLIFLQIEELELLQKEHRNLKQQIDDVAKQKVDFLKFLVS